MTPGLAGELRGELDLLAEAGLARTLELQSVIERAADFTSNDYLGLALHPEVIAASQSALAEFGAGARASRLLGGGSPLESLAEERLAEWVETETALLFPTGFQANLGLITSLAGSGDLLLCDARIHASMIDACRLTKAQRRIFAHNDLQQLAQALVHSRGARRRIVLVESIYSMDGDLAPLAPIAELCEQHDAWMVVDEAHAIGVCGARGAGLVAELSPRHCARVLARVMTGGKALGCGGGFVASSKEVREQLINNARSFIFTTGISPGVAGGLLAAIGLAEGAEEQRAQLRVAKEQLASALQVPIPAGAILPVVIGDNQAAVALSDRLREAGCEVRAVRPPTVPEGTARLRVVLHSYNSRAAVQQLAGHLATVSDPLPPPTKTIQAPLPLAIVGTDTDIGKTVVSALVSMLFAKSGACTYWKPVQTGTDSDTRTVQALSVGSNIAFSSPAVHFPLPASPHTAAAAAGESIHFDSLLLELERERQQAAPGTLVVELAGGLLVPYNDTHTQADWLKRVQPRIVLVARSGLGTLNHTLLTLESLRARQLDVEALFLVGEPHPANCATLKARSGVPILVEVPVFNPLGPEALSRWVDQHQGLLS